MRICVLCHFETEVDDVMLSTVDGRCICIRCYGRETVDKEHQPPVMSKSLRKDIIAALTTLETT